jgi:hypothetical protein
MLVLPMRDVDLLHATVDINAPIPDERRLMLYQALVVESEVARLVHQQRGAALLASQFGVLSAARILCFSTVVSPMGALPAQHHQHVLVWHVLADVRTRPQSQCNSCTTRLGHDAPRFVLRQTASTKHRCQLELREMANVSILLVFTPVDTGSRLLA